MFRTNIRADALYRALRSLGTVSKTFRVEETRTTTDQVSGKSSTKRTYRSDHAPVLVIESERSTVIVDLDKLRDFIKKLGRTVLDVAIVRDNFLRVVYPDGDFALLHLNGTPGAQIDLRDLSVPGKEVMNK